MWGFYTLNPLFFEWMVTALHGFTSTQINRYYTDCTKAEGQCTINCRPFSVIYLSTIRLRFGLFAHASMIPVLRKSDRRWQQLYWKQLLQLTEEKRAQ